MEKCILAGVPSGFALLLSLASQTADAGGTLESVSKRFAVNGSLPNSIAVDIYGTGAGGSPVGLLGMEIIARPSLGATLGWYAADFASLGSPLVGGTSSAIRARPGTPGGIDIGAATSNTYGGGISWTSIDSGATWTASPYGYDISFVITALPEPGSLALCRLSYLTLAFTGRFGRTDKLVPIGFSVRNDSVQGQGGKAS
jgi:hypothetical protein